MSRLDEIKARREAVTTRDWSYRSTSNPKMDASDDALPIWRIEAFWPDGRAQSGPGMVKADAEFAVHAPEDVDYLLIEIERLRAALKQIDIGCTEAREFGPEFTCTLFDTADDWCLACLAHAALTDQGGESDADYIRTEAERLPNGTAARFLAALDAMDGATEPLDGGEL